jgi:hypothetical protein
MKKLVIQSFSDSNIAGYDWVINVVLTQRKNGYFSLRATQISDEPVIYKTPLIYPIKNGSQLRLAIDEVFQDDLISHLAINWEEIIKNLEKYYPDLSNQLYTDIHELKRKELEEELLEEEEKLKNKPLNDWINKSSWTKSTRRDPLGMGAGIENSRRRIAVFQYAQRYLETNNSLPIGRHSINESVHAETHLSIPTKFNFVVDFPEKAI